jgi:pyridoxal phosphate enzyme (YggS family)
VVTGQVQIADNLARLTDEIARAALRAGRQPAEVTLVGATKTQPAERVVEAIRAGLSHIGENRVQEAATKFPVIHQLLAKDSAVSTQHSAPAFHMVGHLQSNKAAAAIGLFDRVDSVDSVRLAQALSRRLPLGAQLPILVEVYVGDDPQRPGVRPAELVDTVGQILELPGLRLDGLMTIAPLDGDARTAFAQVRTLKHNLSEVFPVVHFGVLSMGMSDDYVIAIEEGSTEVRIGTALFGPRQPRP